MNYTLNNNTGEFYSRQLQIDLKTQVRLKQGIWLYFLLLIFEGAIRKWLLPGLATPLLVVRDPIAILVLVSAWQKGYLRFNAYCQWIAGITLISCVLTLLFGHQNLYVAIFGARILIIHFPFMFLMGQILNREDVIAFGKALLWISLPMIFLIALQFYSPQSTWVNQGVGGEGSAGFSGAMGYFRPSGTFSFTNGNTLFWGLLAPFVFYFWLGSQKVNRLLLIAATGSMLLAIPLSISRALFVQVGIALVFSALSLIFKPKFAKTFLIAAVFISLLLVVLSQFQFAQTGIEAFGVRIENASRSEGDAEDILANRVFGGLLSAFTNSDVSPFIGAGLGMGTNVGAILLTGSHSYLIAEGEWGRLTGEMGLLLGGLVILIRIIFSFNLALKSFKKLRSGDILPWLLISFGLNNIVMSQWSQPTTLGFSVVIGGLVLASLKNQ